MLEATVGPPFSNSKFMLPLTPRIDRLRQVCGLVKAKFHYASWFGAGSKPVADQLRTSFESASVMEFGLTERRLGGGSEFAQSADE